MSFFFSVVIPTYNRPQQLENCLKALQALDYPRSQFEVVIVDDGSNVDLSPIVAAFSGDLDVRLLKQANAGPGKARNQGVAKARGEYIAFTDDDCMPHADWLSKLALRLARSPDALIGGHTLNVLTHNPYSSASQSLIDYVYEYYGNRSQGFFFASNNIAMARSQYLDIGGFDVSFPFASEDRDMCDRWQQHQYPMIYAPEAKIDHAHALLLRTFWRQHFSYGQGAFRFHLARAQRTQDKIKVEPISFYLNLLAYPLEQGVGTFQLSLSGLLLLSQMASTVGFFWEKTKQHKPLAEAAHG